MTPAALKFRIGLFLVAAGLLFIGSLFFFGVTTLFKKETRFVTFFPESVQGLSEGSRVRFRGVTIGQVTDIRLSLGPDVTGEGIPVLYKVDLTRLRNDLGVTEDLSTVDAYERVIREGFTAKLENESILTGQLYIDLDFRPDARKADAEPRIVDDGIRVVPSVPSTLSDVTGEALAIIGNISKVDFAGISAQLSALLARFDETLKQVEPAKTAANLNETLDAVRSLAASPELRQSLAEVSQLLASTEALVSNLRTGEGPLGEPLARTVAEISETTDAVRKLAESMADSASDITGPVAELEATLVELKRAARSIQSLVDFLRRHPNALLFGSEQP